ncbi:MAG: protease pro-enzyme activation domain-containing protein [Limisphaerales bacterium]
MARRSVFGRWLPGWLFAVIISLPRVAEAEEMRVLHGHVPPAMAQLQPLGLLPQTNYLRLALSLPLRNRTALDNLLQQIYDPNSPNYHHYLTPEQFTESFGPSVADYEAVIHFAATNGLTVAGTHPNRMLVDVEGRVADIERIFHVTMRVYRHPTENRTFYAPDADPSLDPAIPVLDISGLDNYVIPHPMNVELTPAGKRITPAAGSGPSATYWGGDFRAAYAPGVALTGSGQKIGLFELEGYYATDITSYESQADLPNVALTNELIDGATGPDSEADAIAEVSLDIEMSISMAPGVSNVIIYEGPTPDQGATLANVDDVLNQMATDDSAKQLSSSWSWGGGTNATTDQIFLEYGTQGQSFFEASGDSGAYRGTISEPCDDPYITLVGGTTLTTTGPGGSRVSETTWSWFPSQADASSGGISTLFSIPSWQKPVSMSINQGSTTKRNLPDVALTANNVWVIYDNGQSGDFGGTSCAAPLWAGFTALINQRAVASKQSTVGFVNPAIYTIGLGANYKADFHDITTGNNTNGSSHAKFYATNGFDLCTGWGTPNGTNLIGALTPGSSPIASTLVWTNPVAIVYGAALGSTQLNASANVPGTFAYAPPAGVVLNAGTNLLSVVFNPNDTFDYSSVTARTSLVVSPASLTVTATSTNRPFDQPNPVFQGSVVGLQNGDNITATCSCSATSTSPVGAYPIVPSLNDPADRETNYQVNLVNGTLTVEQAVVTITWSSPAPITYGSALSATQLDATANVPGTFAYNPAIGAILNEGTNTLTMVFTPNDNVDYLTATDAVSLVVTAPQTQGPEGEPLFPAWGVVGLWLGLAALGAAFLRRRTPARLSKTEGRSP